jgi:hypothetical protein
MTDRALTRLRAWRDQPQIDAALAAGTDPWRSAELLARAVELTALEDRRKLAAALDELVTRAHAGRQGRPYRRLRRRRPAAPFPTLRRREVLEQRDGLLALASRIGAPAPVPVSVVARLMLLLCDGSSPVFVAGGPADGLATTVSDCLDALDRGSSEGSLAP